MEFGVSASRTFFLHIFPQAGFFLPDISCIHLTVVSSISGRHGGARLRSENHAARTVVWQEQS